MTKGAQLRRGKKQKKSGNYRHIEVWIRGWKKVKDEPGNIAVPYEELWKGVSREGVSGPVIEEELLLKIWDRDTKTGNKETEQTCICGCHKGQRERKGGTWGAGQKEL